VAERTISTRTYLLVCALLVLATFLTVGLSFVDLGGGWHLAFGMGIGVCKAALVVLFFMHALISPRLTWIVIAVVIYWAVFILAAMTLTDYVSRGLVPYTPGH
jgi:caa(3)-type oxidase subunit IV